MQPSSDPPSDKALVHVQSRPNAFKTSCIEITAKSGETPKIRQYGRTKADTKQSTDLVAERAGLSEVPCWVREMSDDDAYMALALYNAQGELHPLEVGMHALNSGLSQEAYGKAISLSQQSVSIRVQAAKVVDTTRVVDQDRWRHLAEIHASPRWLWTALAAAMLAGE